MIRRINFFGGPGSGKSTIAHRIFAELKILGYQVEFVGEYVKKWAYAGIPIDNFSQVYIFGKQLYAEYSVLKTVKCIITECPIMMHIPYCDEICGPDLFSIGQKFENQFPSLNIYLERLETSEKDYQNWGRYENYEQAVNMSERIRNFLQKNFPFVTNRADQFSNILDVVVSRLGSIG